ncbi:hypothetical protein DIS24_g2726 [Lasiodiplodia hormozganensis]|uniref:Alpha-L-rhamnosidase six-hairpin glycosidase domain-containing protein n=1 Tax=Lasiodiplodia hormozganensis TaxID=869390 RepID=A0AA39Z0G9_9PEZI|nr:hypothetical protein DIS24_g2726 [Lasiodiplodia hormozganensis]
MKEETKPKLVFWLCAIQFVASVLILGLNIPPRMFVRLHGGPDKLVEGRLTQLRQINGSGFDLDLWSVELACWSGVCGILVFLALLIAICCLGWTRLVRKIRNPTSLTAKEYHSMRYMPAKMVFLHPRVIISACLLLNLFFAATACVAVFVNNAASDHLDTSDTSGPRWLGTFDIEVYLCELVPWWIRDGPEMALMLTRERCMLATGARWLTLFSSVLSVVQFFSCWRDTVCDGPTEAAFPGPWDSSIYAPSARTVSPKSILSVANASVISPYPGANTLQGNGSALVFDFGLEVGGIVHLSYSAIGSGVLGLAFSEAKNWIGLTSDSSNGLFEAGDGAIYDTLFNTAAASNRSYVMPDEKLRGGFRYLTLFLLTNSTAATSIDIGDVQLELAFQPTWANLRAYQGYFHSSDELLNRVWYAGAYTLQTNAVPVNTGRAWPAMSAGWANNGSLANGSTVIVDGAKRDRAVWPGDMGVAVPAAYVSTGELESVRNALQVMYDYQEADGAIPEAGPPLLQKGSDTYHMWTMIGTYNYVLYTGDLDFLELVWDRYIKAMDYVYAKVDGSGLLNVTGTRDWARWQQGWNNTQANMILYHTLTTAATLADWHTNTTNSTLSSTFLSRASSLRTAINTHTWDASASLYRDNATLTTLHPQDANALSLYFSVAPSNQTSAISAALTQHWTPIGAEPPELPGNISPFISSLELHGHIAAGAAARALDLVRRSWGWYADHANGTGGSTVIEGYRTDGSFGYRAERGYGHDPSYVSHAHGWSAGPTSVLTEGIVGLAVRDLAGRKWALRPLWGDLGFARAGFTTPMGKFEAGWERSENGTTVVWWSAPEGTKGEVVVGNLGSVGEVTLEDDGEAAEGVEVGDDGSVRVEVVATGGEYKMVIS